MKGLYDIDSTNHKFMMIFYLIIKSNFFNIKNLIFNSHFSNFLLYDYYLLNIIFMYSKKIVETNIFHMIIESYIK